MRIVFAVFFLLIAYVASYPSFRDSAIDNDENDLDLELRSILNHLTEEQLTRALTADEDSDDDDEEDEFSKRQGGHNIVDQQSKCEIECIYNQRNPKSGKGKTVKESAKVCKNLCPAPSKKRGNKKTPAQKKSEPKKKLNAREFFDDDDDDSNNNEDEQIQRREFYNYLLEQLQ